MPELFELTEAERMELELAGRLEEWADSVAEVVAAEYALTDWTTTDDQGRRWGVSPGQLHLGDITLPLPFYFSGNSLQREAAARRAWEDQDILNGANAQALRSSWRERAEAIRNAATSRSGRDPRSARGCGARSVPSDRSVRHDRYSRRIGFPKMTGATVADALPPRLDPKTIEEPLYRSWSEAGYFHVEPGSGECPTAGSHTSS